MACCLLDDGRSLLSGAVPSSGGAAGSGCGDSCCSLVGGQSCQGLTNSGDLRSVLNEGSAVHCMRIGSGTLCGVACGSDIETGSKCGEGSCAAAAAPGIGGGGGMVGVGRGGAMIGGGVVCGAGGASGRSSCAQRGSSGGGGALGGAGGTPDAQTPLQPIDDTAVAVQLPIPGGARGEPRKELRRPPQSPFAMAGAAARAGISGSEMVGLPLIFLVILSQDHSPQSPRLRQAWSPVGRSYRVKRQTRSSTL
jgi:hypothetical protein